MRINMVTQTGMKRENGRTARVISVSVRLSGRTDKPKSEELTIEKFEQCVARRSDIPLARSYSPRGDSGRAFVI